MPRPRLVLFFCLSGAIGALALGVGFRAAARGAAAETARADLERLCESFGAATASARAADDRAALQSAAELCFATSGARITVIAVDGTVQAETAREAAHVANHFDRPEIVAARRDGVGLQVRPSATTGRSYLYVALRGPDGVFIRAARPVTEIYAAVGPRWSVVAIGAALSSLVFAACGLVVVRRVERRVLRQRRAAERLARGEAPAADRGDAEAPFDDPLAAAMNRVSERMQSQVAEVEARRSQIAEVFDAVSDGLVAIDREDAITHANAAAAEFFGEAGPVVGRPYWEVLRHPILPDLVARVRNEGRPSEADLFIGDGLKKREFDARVSPIHEADGEAGGVVLSLRDVTRLRRLEAVRRDFVANVSHELKTPLTSIIAAVETLQGGALDDREAADDFLGKIGRNAKSLARIVVDLLELSRIEAGGIRFAAEPTDVSGVVAEALAAVGDQAREKGIKLSVVDASEPAFVRGDPDLLTRALVNLLENAIAYTDKGGAVAVRTETKDGRVEVSVADTGIGVPRAELERIFERFYRVDRARSRASGGTGLGLAIVRHVAEKHGGAIRVVSDEGRGSTFTLSIPLFGENAAIGPIDPLKRP